MKLNRLDLFEKRKDKIEEIKSLVEGWHQESPGPIKEALKNDILEKANADQEFSYLVKALLEDLRDRGYQLN